LGEQPEGDAVDEGKEQRQAALEMSVLVVYIMFKWKSVVEYTFGIN
jgi:hypothetical protein